MYIIYPNNTKFIFLKILLLHKVVGLKCFEYLRTDYNIIYETYYNHMRHMIYYMRHNNNNDQSYIYQFLINQVIYETYKEACIKLGLLKYYIYWDDTLSEVNEINHSSHLRSLFTSCNPSNPLHLWEKYKDCISKDILNQKHKMNGCTNIY